MKKDYRYYMNLAMRQAKQAEGKTLPNPLVGALVVKNNRILARGYHKKAGLPHAEIVALSLAGKRAAGATLYVTLEPCAHFGRTPPCTDMIIKSGIKKVVCATLDPNSQVNGRGIRALREGGVEVRLGILEEEAKKLNEVYIKFITTGLPFVMLKVAQTLDGRIATKLGDSKWITEKDSRRFVHSLRASVDAVLVGAGTVKRDDPELTIHDARGKDPIRIFLDSSGRILRSSRIIKENKNGKTVTATTNRKPNEELKEKVEVWNLKKSRDGKVDLKCLLRKAGENQITSLLVEGGSEVFTSFFKEKLVDKIYYFLSPKILGKGLDSFGDLGIKEISDSIVLSDFELQRFRNDLLVTGYPVWRS